jgi:hypothetical protein
MRLRRFQSWCSISTVAITVSVASSASLRAQNLQQAFILQGFVSPTSDPFLAGISFGEIGFAANTMGFDLRFFDGTFLSGPSLFYFFEPGAHAGSSYFLPTNVLLAPNTLYAIVLESNPSGGFAGVSGSGPGSVPNGLLFLPTVPHDGSAAWARVGDDMLGFNAAFTTATPEPTTLMLLATGIFSLALGLRSPARKRKTSAS